MLFLHALCRPPVGNIWMLTSLSFGSVCVHPNTPLKKTRKRQGSFGPREGGDYKEWFSLCFSYEVSLSIAGGEVVNCAFWAVSCCIKLLLILSTLTNFSIKLSCLSIANLLWGRIVKWLYQGISKRWTAFMAPWLIFLYPVWVLLILSLNLQLHSLDISGKSVADAGLVDLLKVVLTAVFFS